MGLWLVAQDFGLKGLGYPFRMWPQACVEEGQQRHRVYHETQKLQQFRIVL